MVDDHKTLDLLTTYIGETFRKYIGRTWFMYLKDKENAFYHMPALTSEKFSGVKYNLRVPLQLLGADPNIPNDKGDIALHHAAENNLQD